MNSSEQSSDLTITIKHPKPDEAERILIAQKDHPEREISFTSPPLSENPDGSFDPVTEKINPSSIPGNPRELKALADTISAAESIKVGPLSQNMQTKVEKK